LRTPLFLVFLFLFYLLGKHSIVLVRRFSLSLGYSETLVTVLSTLLLVFFAFIGLLIVQSFFRDSNER
jgi:hypothetical protein